MMIIKREIVKKDKLIKCYFAALVLKSKIIENKTKGKYIDFVYNNCDTESFMFNGKLHLLN